MRGSIGLRIGALAAATAIGFFAPPAVAEGPRPADAESRAFAAKTAAGAPRLVGRSLLYKSDDPPGLELKFAALRLDGAMVAIVHQGGTEGIDPQRVVHIVARADGTLARSRTLDFDLLSQDWGNPQNSNYAVRPDGTAAYLETRDKTTSLIEIGPDGDSRRRTVEGGDTGYLLTEWGDAYLAIVGPFSGEEKQFLVRIDRGGKIVWRREAPASAARADFKAVHRADGSALVLFTARDENAKERLPNRISAITLAPDGREIARRDSRLAGEGAWLTLVAISPAPTAIAFTGIWFGSGDWTCGWLDGAGRLQSRFGATARTAKNCPTYPMLALADLGMIGVQTANEGEIQPDLIRIDGRGMRRWFSRHRVRDDEVRSILVNSARVLWLVGQHKNSDGLVDEIFAERYAFP